MISLVNDPEYLIQSYRCLYKGNKVNLYFSVFYTFNKLMILGGDSTEYSEKFVPSESLESTMFMQFKLFSESGFGSSLLLI